MTNPLVVKFGGDALALPERIAEAARLVGQRLTHGPVVAVASARRGITDHLLGLVEQVKENLADGVDNRGAGAAADRAVAAGELVSASLLALALNRRGIEAEVLDARQAGLRSDGAWTRAQLTRVSPKRISDLLRRGIVPVVTGFQGWHRGRTTTLGRGGSDTTAVALAVALQARQCELVKHHGGVFTADPKVVPEARVMPQVGHRFLTELAAAGAKVIAYRAAAVAEQASLSLRFSSLHDGKATEVVAGATSASSVALRTGRYRFTGQSSSRVTLEQQRLFLAAGTARGVPVELELVDEGVGSRIELLLGPEELELGLELARGLISNIGELTLLSTGVTTITVLGVHGKQFQLAQAASGAHIVRTTVRSDRIGFLVPDADAHLLARALHSTLLATSASETNDALPSQDSPEQRQRIYVGHR